MKMKNRFIKFGPIFGLILSLCPAFAVADLAILIDTRVLVETNPEEEPLEEGEIPGEQAEIGVAKNASYLTSGGWAVTSPEFIDAATMVFDFGATASVTAATLKLPIETVFAQNGSARIKLEFYSADGIITFTDYTNGFPAQIGETDAFGLTQIQFDVTGAVNSVLNTSRYVGFRALSVVAPSAVEEDIPTYTGVKFLPDQYLLEFVPGPPPASNPSTGSFDGFTLEVPDIDIASVGEVYAQFRLVDPNNQIFELTQATVTGTGSGAVALSGMQLFDCDAFTAPTGTAIGATGRSSYSINSGVLDVPDTTFQGKQFSVRIEFIEGSSPLQFELLNFSEISAGPSEAVLSDLAGGLNVEPTQDFIPACHGWIIISDSIRNRFVERNVVSGETGQIYPFNTFANQMSLYEDGGLVYFLAHPESTRLYKLDLNSGVISYGVTTQTLSGLTSSHTYAFTLRDLAVAEDGNVFAILIDEVQFNPGDDIPFATSGKWMGVMDTDGNFLTASLPLSEPIRIEYDPVRDHVFLATASNLATIDYDTVTHSMIFVPGTDIEVGGSCTDFSISPDGNRLAYSCPNGNDRDNIEFSIWDMDPRVYHNIDGEWVLEDSPVSAVFNQEGTILIASDNSKLYFFDVVTHLLLEDYELGLLENETVKRIRFSKDGGLIIISLNNDIHIEGSRFLYMPTPAITGTPLSP